MSILAEILENTRKDVAEKKQQVSEDSLKARCQNAGPARSLERALRRAITFVRRTRRMLPRSLREFPAARTADAAVAQR